MRETKNTLDGLEFNYDRRSGNSTKQIDAAIKYLFDGHIVEVRDHWENGTNKSCNTMLLRRICDRFGFEHRSSLHRIKANIEKLTIELRPDERAAK